MAAADGGFRAQLEKFKKDLADHVPFSTIIGEIALFEFIAAFYEDSTDCSDVRIGLQWFYVTVCAVLLGPAYAYYTYHEINDEKVKYVIPWQYMLLQFVSTWVYLLCVHQQPIACHLNPDAENALSELYLVQAVVLVLCSIGLSMIDRSLYFDGAQIGNWRDQKICDKCWPHLF